MRRRGRRLRGVDVIGVGVAVAIAVITVWLLIPAGWAPTWWGADIDDVPVSQIRTSLETLTVRHTDDATPYHREEFGQRWADEDGNGCDTRNDVLARDLDNVTIRRGTGGCVVSSGTLDDPYTGSVIHFRRGPHTSPLVQIDHVVALADAWDSGAWAWDAPRRQRFANDPDNLLAVDGQANEEKGKAAADRWMPLNRAFHCEYVARQVAIKAKWALSVTASERQAMIDVLAGCPAMIAPLQGGSSSR